ncbi:ISAzo13-like element transposase-related protein [Streptomyces sp. AS58]|uniref:ISAzo13-like element transposase-related protein n=1 Tax=Streptomyces sp. AS58 TaxID=1519489 RepID=UPI00099D9FC8
MRRWRQGAGRTACPTADRLQITADADGPDGYRARTWKTGLARFTAETKLTITVRHFPPGTHCRCPIAELPRCAMC